MKTLLLYKKHRKIITISSIIILFLGISFNSFSQTQSDIFKDSDILSPVSTGSSFTFTVQGNTDFPASTPLFDVVNRGTVTSTGGANYEYTAPAAVGTGFDTLYVEKNGGANYDTAVIEIVSATNVYDVMKDSAYCQGASGAEIWLSNSENNEDYELYKNGTATGDTITGDGDSISFGDRLFGQYTILNVDDNIWMNGTATVSEITPNQPNFIYLTSSPYCAGSGVEFGLDTSEVGVDYELYEISAPGTVLATVSGNGDSLSFGSYNTAGSYTARATNGTCSEDIDDTLDINESPTAYNLDGPPGMCHGTVSVQFTLSNSEDNIRYDLINQNTGITYANQYGSAGNSLNFTVSDTGKYYVLGVDTASSCTTPMNGTVDLTYYPKVNASASADTTEICNGNVVGISASSSTTATDYSWTPTASVANPDQPSTNATPSSNTTYEVVITDDNGCKDSAEVEITVNPLPNAEAGDDTTMCEGDTIRLSAGGGYPSYSWSYPSTLSDPNKRETNAWPGTSTTYTVTVTTNKGCQSTDTVRVEVDAPPTPNVNDPEVCNGRMVSLTANGGDRYYWPDFADSSQTISFVATTDADYVVEVISSNGCDALDTANVTVNQNPTITTTPTDTAVCEDETVAINGSATGGAGDYSYSWTSSLTGTTTGGNPLSFTATSDVSYSVTVTDNEGCEDSTTVPVTVHPLPNVSISGFEPSYCKDEAPDDEIYGFPQDSDGEFLPDTIITDDGDGTGTFDPSTVTPNADHTIIYSYTTMYGCTDTAMATTFVSNDTIPDPVISDLDSAYCDDDPGPYTITGNPTDAQGAFSGIAAPGLVDNGDGTATLRPDQVGTGTHTITYTYTSATGGCSGSVSETFQIGVPITLNVQPDYCESRDTFYLTVNKPPNTGAGTFYVFSGATGDTLYSAKEGTDDAVFLPSSQGVGDYGVKYEVADTVLSCASSDSAAFTVHPVPNADFTLDGIPYDTSAGFFYCNNDTVVELQGVVNTGTFSGSGVYGSTFVPDSTVPGDVTITHTYTNLTTGCSNSASTDVTIKPVPDVTINGLGNAYCNSVAQVNMSASVDSGYYTDPWNDNSVFLDKDSGKAELYPVNVPNPDVTYDITFTGVAGNGCTNDTTYEVYIGEKPNVYISGIPASGEICKNDSTITLTGHPTDANGTFKNLDFLVDSGNGKASINPRPDTVSAGIYEVVYEYVHPVSGCVNTDTQSITILPLPTKYSLNGGGVYCEGDTGRLLSLSGSQSGTRYQLYKNGSLQLDTLRSSGGNFDFAGLWPEGIYHVEAVHPNGCSVRMNNTDTVSVNYKPEDAHSITGDDTVAVNGTGNYSLPALDYANIYKWILPSGASISSGLDTRSITVTFSGTVSPGLDTVSVYAKNGCGKGDTAIYEILILEQPDTAGPISGDSALCEGDKGVTYSIPDIDNADSIQWTLPSGFTIVSGSGSNTITVDLSNSAGSGYVIARGVNASGPGYPDSLHVEVNPIPVTTGVSVTDMLDCAVDSVLLIGHNPNASATFKWVGGTKNVNSDSIWAEEKGDYTFTATLDGCSHDTTVTVKENKTTPFVEFKPTDTITCANPAVDIEVDTANGSYDYVWSAGPGGSIVTGDSTQNPTVDSAATYNVTVTDPNNSCTVIKTVTVEENRNKPAFSLSDPLPITCARDTAIITSTNVPDASYEWSGPAGSIIAGKFNSSVTVNQVGTYSLKVTRDDNGCSDTKSKTVVADSSAPTNIDITKSSDLTCDNTQVTITASTATSGVSYEFAPATTGNLVTAPTDNPAVVDQHDQYNVTITKNSTGCSVDTSITVNDDAAAVPVSMTVAFGNITCNQPTDTLTIDSDLTNKEVEWSASGGGHFVTSIFDPQVVVDAAGTYTAIVTDTLTGCSETEKATITEDFSTPVINSFTKSPDSITCASDVNIMADVTDAVSYSWSGPGTVNQPADDSVFVSKPGTYTLEVTASTGCKTTGNVVVPADTSTPNMVLTTNYDDITCINTEETLNVSSSTNNVTYQWTRISGSGNLTDAGTRTPEVDGPGTYKVVVTDDDNKCTTEGQVSVDTNYNKPVISGFDNEPDSLSCKTDWVTLSSESSTSGATFLWERTLPGTGTILDPTNDTARTNETGTYRLTVTHPTTGCTVDTTVDVVYNGATPTADVDQNPGQITCVKDTVRLDGSASTGVNFQWTTTDGSIVSGQTSDKPLVNSDGTYVLTVEHPNSGCTDKDSVEVTAATGLPTITKGFISTDTLTCKQDTIDLKISSTSGDIYWWSTSGGNIVSGDSTFTATIDQPGTYYFTSEDTSTGCTFTESFTIDQNIAKPNVSFTSDLITCTVDTVQINSTLEKATDLTKVTYQWAAGAGGNIVAGDENLANPRVHSPATYNLTLTDDVNGCKRYTSHTVGQNKSKPSINVNKDPKDLTCDRNQVTLEDNTGQTDVSYKWTGPGNIGNKFTPTPTVDAPGMYTLRITKNDNGCYVEDSVEVELNDSTPDVFIDPADDITCNKSQVLLEGDSPDSVSYQWTGPGNITDPGSRITYVDAGGSYTLTVKDKINGCTNSDNITVNEDLNPPSPPQVGDTSTCYGTANVPMNATGTNIKWYANAGPSGLITTGNSYTPTFTSPGDSVYYVTQTGTNGCESNVEQVVYTIHDLPGKPTGDDESVCFGEPNPFMQAYPTNSQFDITWYDDGNNFLSSSDSYKSTENLPATYEYRITQTDTNGCESEHEKVYFTINDLPSAPVVEEDTLRVCYGSASQSFVAYGTNVKWYNTTPPASPIATGNVFTPTEVTADTFTYYVTQSNSTTSCESDYTEVKYIILPNPAKFDITGGGSYCEGTGGLEIQLNGSEASATYELRKDGNTFITGVSGTGGNVSFGDVTAEGTYTAYATSSNGCVAKMNGTAIIDMDPLPEDAGTIVGDSIICQGTSGVTYKVPDIQYANDYTWSVPTGATIVAGNNSNEITVDYSNTAQDGMVTVYGSNACGDGGTSTGHAITVNELPDAAGAITGPASVCQGATDVAFEVASIPNATSYEWTLPSGGTIVAGEGSRQIKVNFSLSASNGLVKVYGKNSCGTGAESNTSLTVNSTPQITTDDYRSVCGSTDSLIVNDPGGGATVQWTLIQGSGTIDDNNAFRTEVTGLGTGQNMFRVTVSNGTCDAMDTVTIENNKLFVNAGADATMCKDSLLLSGNEPDPGVTGTWSVEKGSALFADANQYNTKVTELGRDTNVLRWTMTKNGCDSYDEVTYINNMPTEAEAGLSRNLCMDSSVLGANTTLSDETGKWSIVNGYVNFADKNDPNTKITDVAKGENTLQWTITKKACTSSDQVKMTNNKVVMEAGDDQVICSYKTTMNASPAPAGTNAYWRVDQGSADILDPDSPTTDVYLLLEDTTILEWVAEKNGCLSYDSMMIINDSPTKADAGDDQAIAQFSTFLDATPPTKGTGEWSLLSGAGTIADKTDPKTEVTGLAYGKNVFQWIVSHNSCTSMDTVIVDNQSTGGITAGNDTTICDDQIILSASEPVQGEGEWSVVTGSATFLDKNDNNTLATGLSKGTNKLRWTVVGNGIVSDEVVITNNSPSEANAGPDMTYCADSADLTANNPAVGTGVWTIIGGAGVFDDSTQNNTTIQSLGSGKNTLRWTITHQGCVSEDEVIITNNKPTEADAGVDQTNCSSEAVLYGNSPAVGDGLWTLVSGSNSVVFQDQNVGNTIVENLGHGDNILRWTITNGNCTSSDDVVITNDNPTIADAGRDKDICVDNFQLNANEAVIGDGKWTVITGYGEFDDTSDHYTKVRNLDKGDNILRWTITHNSCISYDEVQISNNTVDANAGFDQELCVDSTSLSANNPAPGTGFWSVIAGSANFEDPNDPNTDVKGLDYRVPNILKWTISNKNCVSTDTVTIHNYHPGIIYAGVDKETCEETVTLKANPNYLGTGTWEPLIGGGDIVDPNSAATRVTDLGLGKNTFRWSVNRNGCLYMDEVTVSNNSPVEAYAGEDDSTCVTSYVLHGEEPPFGRGKWTVVAGSGEFENDTAFSTTVNNLAQGINTFRWTLYNGQCSTSDEVTIVVNKPDVPRAGPDKNVCTDSTILQGNQPSPGQKGYWEIVEGSAQFEDPNDPHTRVRGLNYGRNVLRWNIEYRNCKLYDEVTIYNNSPTKAFAGDDMHVCGEEARLNALKPTIGTGEWSLVSGTVEFEDKSKANSRVTGLSYGPNTLRWTTTNNGCTSIDEVTVYNDQATAYAGVDQTVYESSTYLVGNTPTRGEGKWVILGGSGTFENPDSAQTLVRDLAPGVNTFRWTITNNACVASDEVSITYYEMPKVEFTIDKDRGCPPLTIQFLNKSLGTNSQFEWDFGDNNISTHENPRHTYYEPGEYTVELSTIGPDGSKVTDDTTIIVHKQPLADFDVAPKKLFIPEQHLQCYNMSIEADRFLWRFGDDSTSALENPTHVYKDTGVYTVELHVWSQYNCYDSTRKEKLVEVVQSGKIKFPSGFTPNPSGPVGGRYNKNSRDNDVFHPIVKGVQEYNLEIFNRWGVLVFQSDDVNVGWDGYYQGKLAAEGVYIYKVYGRYNNGKTFEKVGDFVLIRK